MTVLDFITRRRRRELTRAAERVGLQPAEHPGTTLGRDAAAARVPDVVRYPSSWDCPRCQRPNPIGATYCRSCDYVAAFTGARR